jgi:ubiquinone/menaquinone biosynthesis C-methylase UbiE
MLEVGKKRAIERGIFDELQFMVANAEMLIEI